MKLSVLGAGAIGSMLGGLIQQHDPQAEVLLISRGEHAAAMRRQRYVELRGPWGTYRPEVRISENVEDIAGSDHVLLTVKSHDTQPAMEAARPHLESAIVTSIQNGINHGRLAEYVSPDRLVMGLTVANVAVVAPGCVELQIDGLTAVGPGPDKPATSHVRDAQQVLEKTGLAVELHEPILGMQYNKLVINCLGCASAVSNLNVVREGLFHDQWRRAVAWPIYNECLAVFQQAGLKVEPLAASSDVGRLKKLLHALDQPVVGRAIHLAERAFVRRKPTKFSVRQDLDRKHATEVDFINGEIVRLAEKSGGSAPYNALVVDMVRAICDGAGDGVLPREEVIRQFRQVAGAPNGV